ncbi:hypothetical protein [Flavobacterium sp.]|uniref:hypothetical protein n=1 Tax=Flavobacterium sp. TaxID=239 RepID=UPI0037BF47B6
MDFDTLCDMRFSTIECWTPEPIENTCVGITSVAADEQPFSGYALALPYGAKDASLAAMAMNAAISTKVSVLSRLFSSRLILLPEYTAKSELLITEAREIHQQFFKE